MNMEFGSCRERENIVLIPGIKFFSGFCGHPRGQVDLTLTFESFTVPAPIRVKTPSESGQFRRVQRSKQFDLQIGTWDPR